MSEVSEILYFIGGLILGGIICCAHFFTALRSWKRERLAKAEAFIACYQLLRKYGPMRGALVAANVAYDKDQVTASQTTEALRWMEDLKVVTCQGRSEFDAPEMMFYWLTDDLRGAGDCPNCSEPMFDHDDGCGYFEFLRQHPDGIGSCDLVSNEDGIEWVRGHVTLEKAAELVSDYVSGDWEEDKPTVSHVWMKCIGRTQEWDESWLLCGPQDFGAVAFTQIEEV